jgi:DNA-binding response OmpR family regulator
MIAKIMVIDGEQELRNRYQNELEALGYEVTCAASAQNALKKFRQRPADLVITEIKLPDSTGFDCLDSFIKVKRDVKLVINTNSPTYRDDFHSWLADAFLTKSTDLSELVHTISLVLDRKKRLN